MKAANFADNSALVTVALYFWDKIRSYFYSFVTVTAVVSLLVGCAPFTQPEPSAPQYPLHAAETRFKIATTTSLYDTGLWYYLEPMFEEYADVEMDIIYAGTGIALEYGRKGDVDAVIVHDRAAEYKFIA